MAWAANTPSFHNVHVPIVLFCFLVLATFKKEWVRYSNSEGMLTQFQTVEKQPSLKPYCFLKSHLYQMFSVFHNLTVKQDVHQGLIHHLPSNRTLRKLVTG